MAFGRRAGGLRGTGGPARRRCCGPGAGHTDLGRPGGHRLRDPGRRWPVCRVRSQEAVAEAALAGADHAQPGKRCENDKGVCLMSDATSEPDRIERDLEHTRARMDNHLNALQDRLSPGQILDDMMAYFRGSEGADFTRNLMDSVRSNPLPAALTGIGPTWLMASNPRPQAPAGGSRRVRVYRTADGGTWSSREELERHFAGIEQGVTRRAGGTDEVHHGRLDAARGKALGVARQAGDTAESFRQRVQDAWERAKNSVAEGAHQLQDRAGDAADQAAGYVHSARDRIAGGGHKAREMGGSMVEAVTGN